MKGSEQYKIYLIKCLKNHNNLFHHYSNEILIFIQKERFYLNHLKNLFDQILFNYFLKNHNSLFHSIELSGGYQKNK